MPRQGQDLSNAAEAMALALVSLALVTGVAPAADPALRLRAFAVDPTGSTRVRTQTLEIAIERWSTDEERQKILDTLVERSPEKLLDVVQKIKPRVGFIRRDSGLGWDIRFARLQALPSGGERVVFATDRPMTFFEAVNNTRSKNYEYMIGEIRLGPDGRGEGKLSTAAKVRFDKESGQVEIENYGIEPVRLAQVTVEGKAPSE
jgi:hypothetical protein